MSATKKFAIAIVLVLILLIAGVAGLFRYFQSRNSRVIVRVPQGPAGTTTSLNIPSNWPSEQGHFVSSGALDRRGRLWIGTETGGLWVTRAGGWEHVLHPGYNDVYSMATDLQGRLWVGDDRGGVSVYDGKTWRNYDALSGPLGEHVLAIAICPASAPTGAGDVWLATDLGLTRYSVATDSWSYFTRADGLPSDQASSLAFDSEGNLYVAMQCDGVAIGRGADGYRHWQSVHGPIEPPPASHGSGLPSSNINAILVTRDGMILAGTSHGLALSRDHGATWTFMRGKDWVAKYKEAIDGPGPDWKPADDGAVLAEDNVTALAQDGAGRIWIGYRIKGFQYLSPDLTKVLFSDNPRRGQYSTFILPIPGRSPVMGSYGNGVEFLTGPSDPSRPPAAEASTAVPSFPSPAAAPSAEELQRLADQVNASGNSSQVAAFLGQDWMTQGDWLGRYGRQKYLLPPMVSNDSNPEYQITRRPYAGLRGNPSSGFYYYPDNPKNWTRGMLYRPGPEGRRNFEWNDGGWQQKVFDENFEGPDLWIDFSVPPGLSRVSLYHYMPGGYIGANRRRDFTVALVKYEPDLSAAQHAAPLATVRVVPAQAGAYQTFVVSEGRYMFHIMSNYSYGATLQGIFFDLANPTAVSPTDCVAECLNGTHFDPPQVGPALPTDSTRLRAARALWAALDAKLATTVPLQLHYRTLAYRVATEEKADSSLLANWRWNLHLWNMEDMAQWDKVVLPPPKGAPTTEISAGPPRG